MIVFAGQVFAARGTVKQHTVDARAFGDPDGLPLGRVEFGRVSWGRRRPRRAALPLPDRGSATPRVDIVMHHSDGDTVLFDAAVAAGARGVVLVGTGAGNANPEVADAVRRAVAVGVRVAVSTRVAAGAVAPLYTGGGAVDLAAAGALLTGTLKPGQARIACLPRCWRPRVRRRRRGSCGGSWTPRRRPRPRQSFIWLMVSATELRNRLMSGAMSRGGEEEAEERGDDRPGPPLSSSARIITTRTIASNSTADREITTADHFLFRFLPVRGPRRAPRLARIPWCHR